MGTFGSSKVAKNSTKIDSRQTDAKVAAQGSTVFTAGAGTLDYRPTDKSNQGLINSGRGNISVSSVDPGSFQLASDVVGRAFDAAAASNQAVVGLASTQSDTTAKLAQGSPIGTDWKGLLLPLAVVGAVLALLFMPRRAH